MSTLELWFIRQLSMLSDPAAPGYQFRLGSLRRILVPHLAKIYLMLSESPKEHPGLSPGPIYFPMSGSGLAPFPAVDAAGGAVCRDEVSGG